jgi:hypothetical protein
MLGALEQIHRAIQAAGNRGNESELRSKLQKIRGELEDALAAPRALTLHSGDRTVQLRGGLSFTIGRSSPTSGADVAIACRWMSRGEKNLRVFLQGSAWYVEDLGSTNGHFLDGKRLMPFKSHRLDDGETLVEIGKTGNATAPAWLLFRVSAEGAVHMSFGVNNPADQVASANSSTEWVLFDAEFALGRSPSAALIIPECGTEIEADISLRNGSIWVTPRAGQTIRLDDAEFAQGVPLVCGSTLTIGNSSWAIEEPAAPSAPLASLAASA